MATNELDQPDFRFSISQSQRISIHRLGQKQTRKSMTKPRNQEKQIVGFH